MILHKTTPDSPLILEKLVSISGKTRVYKAIASGDVIINVQYLEHEREYIHPHDLKITVDMMWKFMMSYLERSPEALETFTSLPDCSEWYNNAEATAALNALHEKATFTDKQIFYKCRERILLS